MTASLISSVPHVSRRALQVALSVSLTVALTALVIVGCARAASDARASTSLVTVTGDLMADGSCRASVSSVPLFAPGDRQRASYDAGVIADIAPAGFSMHQLACTPADAAPGVPDRADHRAVLITLYVRDGDTLRAGRYSVRAALADDATSDDTNAATRASVAIFGAPGTVAGRGAPSAGIRYLEARDGTLEITSANGAHVVGRFDVRAAPAWSM